MIVLFQELMSQSYITYYLFFEAPTEELIFLNIIASQVDCDRQPCYSRLVN